MLSKPSIAAIPMNWVGPIKLIGKELQTECMAPLATFETPLWASVHRGAAACYRSGGISILIQESGMTRSLLVETATARESDAIAQSLSSRFSEIAEITAQTSRFIQLQKMHLEQVGNLLYIRLSFSTGDASGHNMTTIAAEKILEWALYQYPTLRYVSISSNYCTDKKTSAVNGILGRGIRVIAEIVLPRKIVTRFLKTTPEKVVSLHVKKNLMGGIVAGSLRTANAHFANILLGFYLATGQDAANIVEGSQGFVHCESREEGLYFSVTLPNIIIGSIGNGKHLPFVQENLRQLGCLEARPIGENAKRLAAIASAIVLCGELSLLAALTNPGELVKAHMRLERGASCKTALPGKIDDFATICEGPRSGPDSFDEANPYGLGEKKERKWPQKGDFNGQMSFATGSEE